MKTLELRNEDGTISNKVVEIDDAYFPHFIGYRWMLSVDGRVYRTEPRGQYGQRVKRINMSRLILGCTKNDVVHHIDRNPLNNRQYNLEIHTLATLKITNFDVSR